VVSARQKTDFMKMVRDDYDGQVKVEITFDAFKHTLEKNLSSNSRVMTIRFLMGEPKIIGRKLMYPVEMPGFAIYNPDRDGAMSDDEATGFLLRNALDRAHPGASALLVRANDLDSHLRLSVNGASLN
jgi:hypothetical protein